MSWATSVLNFTEYDGALRVMALDLQSDSFVPELDQLLNEWNTQRIVCRDAGSDYMTTALGDMIVTSPDVLEGRAVLEGVRYPFKEPNSGWWLFGEQYHGDLSSMLRIHVGDLLRIRGDLRRYMALAVGFCFSQVRQPGVRFDAEVFAEAPI